MLMSAQTALIVGLVTPLVVAILALALRRNLRDAAGPIGAVVTFIASIEVAGAVVAGVPPELVIGDIAFGVDLAFRVTPPGAIFGIVASGLWIVAAVFSTGYMRGNNEKNQTRFAVFYAIAVHAAMGVAWSGNLLMLFVFYEILTASTVPLVTHKQSNEAREAGRLYIAILFGSSVILFLPAMIYVWLATGTLDFTQGGIIRDVVPPWVLPWLLAAFAFGIGKAALMPLHRWLPAAMVAPTPVSALLHAVAVVKAGVFSILMVTVYIFGSDYLVETGASLWLVAVASFTILASSFVALTKDDLKARLAYSTISQLSYIVLGAAIASRIAVEGAALHIVMHAAGKITLFFVAGAIYVQTHIRNISDLDGLGPRMPWLFVAFFIGSLSIIGIPPLGGSWSKFYLMLGAIDAGLVIVLLVLGVSSLLNIYYLMEPVMRAFFLEPARETKIKRHALVVIPPVLTAALSVLLFFLVDHFGAITRLIGAQ